MSPQQENKRKQIELVDNKTVTNQSFRPSDRSQSNAETYAADLQLLLAHDG